MTKTLTPMTNRNSRIQDKRTLPTRLALLAGLVFTAMIACSGEPTHAQTIRWTGAAGDGNINNGGNWDPRLVPSAFLDLVVNPSVNLTSANNSGGINGRSLRVGGSFRFRPFAGSSNPYRFSFSEGLIFDGSNQVFSLGGSGNRRLLAEVRSDFDVTSRNTILLSSGVDWLSTLNTVRFVGNNTNLQVDAGSSFTSDSQLEFSQGASAVIRGGLTVRNFSIESGSRVEIQTGASLDDGISPARLRIDGGTLLVRGNSTVDFMRSSPASLIDVTGGGRFSSSGNSRVGIVRATRGGIDLIGGSTETGTITLNDQSELNLFNNAQLSASALRVSDGSRVRYSAANSISLGELSLTNGTIDTSAFDPASLGLSSVVASGQINASVTGNATTSINLNGDLVLGNVTSAQGYQFGGTLNVRGNRATLHDQDTADLGIQTLLANGGQLVAENGISLGDGETLNATGVARVEGSFLNGGIVNGSHVDGEFLEFANGVSGEGEFTGNILLSESFRPGNSTAAVSFENLELGIAHQLVLELGGPLAGSDFDQLLISGDARIDGFLEVEFNPGFVLGDGDLFEVLQVDGTLSGQFQGLDEGSLIGNFGGQDLFITYAAGDGNDVALFTTVPEPSAATLVAIVGLALSFRRRGIRHLS